MRSFSTLILLALLAAPATAQPYFARGSWDDWQDPPNPAFQMADQGGGHYTATISPLNPGQTFEYRLAEADYDPSLPTTNGKATANGAGEISFHLWTNNGQPWNDGWAPNNVPRAGYDDSGEHDWEVVGSFNAWPGTGDTNYYMTDLGSGLHEGTFTFPTAGSYQFKFRKQGSWDASVGLDFGNGNNIPLRTWDPNETVKFRLDLPNGRYQIIPTLPTPDLNADEYVNGSDYVLWRKGNGRAAPQYDRWRAHFGTEPPPPDTSAFYARASWNGFNLDDPMVNNGGGLYTHTETGLTTGTYYNFKAANNSYTIEAPAFGDVRAAADADGEISLRFYLNNTWSDGWMPNNQYRIGYEDPGINGWELMGEFNGFGGGPQYVMQNDGGGLYSVVVNGLAASDADGYDFKFRRHNGTEGNWDVNIGATFRNNGDNAKTGQIAAGNYKFELDLFNGRWRVVSAAGSGSLVGTVPEPASLALAFVGLAFVGLARRKK